MRRLPVAALAALSLFLVACAEKPQTLGSKKHDAAPWAGAQPSFSAPEWKQGDEASWEAQLNSRAQNQNEYARTSLGQK